ncbi:hypothetical protein GOBAR_AA37443 [Gossypium barbadense]|uniref:Uncharacterized protein n=1 Tax=Gossypium barbadense TaxID=3634 RepID=A0A2P5VWT6_GOSBA|nr:hypothetical protein GOBAR_AA37443 [Gossypium barbadense]
MVAAIAPPAHPSTPSSGPTRFPPMAGSCPASSNINSPIDGSSSVSQQVESLALACMPTSCNQSDNPKSIVFLHSLPWTPSGLSINGLTFLWLQLLPLQLIPLPLHQGQPDFLLWQVLVQLLLT